MRKKRLTSSMLVPVTLVAASLAGFASAAELSPARLVVVLDESVSSEDLDARLRGAFGAQYEARILGVDEALDFGRGPWSMFPAIPRRECQAEPLSSEEIASTLDEVDSLLLQLEYGDALLQLAELGDRLCAAADPFPPGSLGRMDLLLGVARFFSDDPQGAREAFLRAVEHQPDLGWNPDLPPDPATLFVAAKGDAIRSVRTTLYLDPAERPASVWVDGVAIPADVGSVQLVGPEHLLQMDDGDRPLATRVLETGAGGTLQLVGPRRVSAGLALEPTVGAGQVAFPVLVEAARARGDGELLVLANAEAELGWRFDAVDRRWERFSLVLGHRLEQGRQLRDAGWVIAGVGAAMLLSGSIMAASHHTHGVALLDEMDADVGVYDLLVDEYEQHRRGERVGATLIAVGGGLTATGIPLIAQGERIRRAALQDPRLSVAPAAGGLHAGLRFAF